MGVMAHTFSPSTLKAEAGRSLGLTGQPGLPSKSQSSQGSIVNMLPQKDNKTKTLQLNDGIMTF